MKNSIVLIVTVLNICSTAYCATPSSLYRPGLAGTFFNGCDFKSPQEGTHYLAGLDHDWERQLGYVWSGRWAGFIRGPFDGEVTFTVMATDGLRLTIGGTVVIDGLAEGGPRVGKILMKEGKQFPLVLEFISLQGKARLHLYWQWQGQGRNIVPPEALNYHILDSVYVSREAPSGDNVVFPKIEVPRGRQHECVIEHATVYDEPGRYAGWPSNGGFWIWGNEMAVAFECGWFEDRPDWKDGHARDKSRPNEDFVARSTDGGLTWTYKKYDILTEGDNLMPSPGGIDFTHPDFALKCQSNRFYYSYDRAKTWHGPFRSVVTGLATTGKLKACTVYFVDSSGDCFLFFSDEHGDRNDLAFYARAADGGKAFDFVSWISPDRQNASKYERWAVYSATRAGDDHIIAAMQRKYNNGGAVIQRLNWIDLYESRDSGKTWKFLSKVADTDVVNSDHNGNPPDILRLKDGRLCVTYGFRGEPFPLCATFSGDNGKTWSKPVILRLGARNWDFGYPLSRQRPDGKVVTVYYFATPENRDQFIAATIWDPALVK